MKLKCPVCGSTKIQRKGNEVYCQKCGTVLTELYYSGKNPVV